MSELLNAYWPMILVAVAIGLIVGLVAFRRPKQRVTLSKAEAPVRPHMAAAVEHERSGGGEGEDVADEMAAAASDVIGQFVETCREAMAFPTTCSG
jgi:hypothetical protein